jgi:hypothetical protein
MAGAQAVIFDTDGWINAAEAAKEFEGAEPMARPRRDGGVRFYTFIPRTLSLIASIIDDLAKKEAGKSQAAGKTYFGLWCRVWDENLLIIDNETAYALEAGYGGERNTTTWRAHMRTLQKLGFIDVKDGAYGPFNYVLLFNPYIVLRGLKDQIPAKTYTYLVQRAIEIGAESDLLEHSDKGAK